MENIEHGTDSNKTISTSLNIDRELWKIFRARGIRLGKQVKEATTEAITAWLDAHPEP